MDSVEVQEFLLSATATNDSILLETDRIFEKNSDPNNSTQQSLYFSINDDTLSNRLVDDLQRMERTLTEVEEEDDESQKTTEMSSVIQNNNNNNLDLLQTTTKEEEFFQQNLPLKAMFPNHPMRSQCSTPKLEIPAKAIILPDLKLDTSLAIPDLVLPLTTILQKIEKKVTIVEAENKENVQMSDEAGAIGKQLQPKEKNMRKSLKPVSGRPSILAKRPTLRKSMIPNAPPQTKPMTTVAAAIPKVNPQPQPPKPTLMAARRSVRMSVVPTTFKSSRFTIGGAAGGRSGKLNSPAAMKKSPKSRKIGTVTKSSATSTAATSRMTINAAGGGAPTKTITEAVEEKKKIGKIDEERAKKRMSRIPPPASSTSSRPTEATATSATASSITSHPRPVFACTICKKSFHLKSTLLTHQKIHAAKTAAATSASGHFKCAYCDKDFEKEIGLRNHVERYCEKVPVAEKRKLNGSHNRTRTTSAETSRKKEKASSSRLESTSSSVGSSISHTEQSLLVTSGITKKEQAIQAPPHPPASGLSPRKPIKSISHPHSGIKFSANKPIKCFHCKITFNKYVDFHTHVEQVHPQPVGSPVTTAMAVNEEGAGPEEEEKKN